MYPPTFRSHDWLHLSTANTVAAASSLANGEITFFSIDPDLIQGAGYQFDAGALNQLPNQLPRFMGLQITEVASCGNRRPPDEVRTRGR